MRNLTGAGGIGAVLATVLLVNLAMSVYQLPLNRVIERRLCNEYYSDKDSSGASRSDGDIDEHLCKIDHVQKQLGSLQGVMDTIWIMGGESDLSAPFSRLHNVAHAAADFIMTIPLTFLARSKGRRLVLTLNLSSRLFMLAWAVIFTYLDTRIPKMAIVVGPTLSFLGGDCVLNSMMYSLASDLTEDPVRRATYFGYMSSVSYVVALLGPALSSATMSVMLPLPFFLGIGLLLAGLPTIARLPSQNSGRTAETTSPSDEEVTQGLLSSPVLKARDARGLSVFSSVISHIRSLLRLVTSHPGNFSLLLFSFFLTSLASSDTKLLVQYISGRYQWTFASAGYLISGKAVVNFTLLTIVIPRFLRRRTFTEANSIDVTNVRYANYCLAVSIVGALGIALAAGMWMLIPSLLVYAVGSALPIFTLSLLKSPVICPQRDPEEEESAGSNGQIFSIVMLVKTMGSLLGAPLMAALWVGGIGIGGMGMGLPFFISSACYAMAIFVFFSIRV